MGRHPISFARDLQKTTISILTDIGDLPHGALETASKTKFRSYNADAR